MIRLTNAGVDIFHISLVSCLPSCVSPGLPLFWSSASKRGFQLSDVVRLLSQKTAQLCSLDTQKGSLCPGYDADLVIWDPEREFEVCTSSVHQINNHSTLSQLSFILCCTSQIQEAGIHHKNKVSIFQDASHEFTVLQTELMLGPYDCVCVCR